MADRFITSLRHSTLQSADLDVDVYNPESNFLYTTDLYVGSQATPVNLIIDTGSNKMVIFDVSCPDCLQTFNSSASTTFVSQGRQDSISYVDGAYVNGCRANDTVSIDAAGVYSVSDFNFLLGTD